MINTTCTCGEEMKKEVEQIQQVEFMGEDILNIRYKNVHCVNKSCPKYLLLQASEIEE